MSRTKCVWFFLMAFLIIIFCTWFFLFLQSYPVYCHQWEKASIRISMSSHKYLSLNETETFHFVIENIDTQDAEVTVRLQNGGDFLDFLDSEGSNVFYSGSVRSQEQIHRQIKMTIYLRSGKNAFFHINENAGLSLWSGVNSQAPQKMADLPLKMASIAWSRSLSHLFTLLLLGLTVWVGREVWQLQIAVQQRV